MNNFLIKLKDLLFGIVVLLWGCILLIPATSAAGVPTLELIFISIGYPYIGMIFIIAGIINILSKIFKHHNVLASFSNIMVAQVFIIVMLSHLYLSVYAIGWLAFAAIAIHQIINAILLYMNGDTD